MSLWRWHGYKLAMIPVVTRPNEHLGKLAGASGGWQRGETTMRHNEVTSLDAAMTLLFHIVARWRGASELIRWAEDHNQL